MGDRSRKRAGTSKPPKATRPDGSRKSLGRAILGRQEREGWGAKVIDRLSHDLRAAFVDMTVLSARNLKYMRAFAAAWPEREIVQRAAAQIPWRQNQLLLDKLQEPGLRLWYAEHTAEHGWSRAILESSPRAFCQATRASHSYLAESLARPPKGGYLGGVTPTGPLPKGMPNSVGLLFVPRKPRGAGLSEALP